jgi:hypothetical protein
MKDKNIPEARCEFDAKSEFSHSRDQFDASCEDINPVEARKEGGKLVGSNVGDEIAVVQGQQLQKVEARKEGGKLVGSNVGDEIAVVQGQQLQKVPEWDFVDATHKETFQAQSSCYGCTADIIDRVLDDGGNGDTRTVATVESFMATDDKQLPIDERFHDVLMLVGGCISTFLPEPEEKTLRLGDSILNLAVDISEAKFL